MKLGIEKSVQQVEKLAAEKIEMRLRDACKEAQRQGRFWLASTVISVGFVVLLLCLGDRWGVPVFAFWAGWSAHRVRAYAIRWLVLTKSGF